MRDPIIDGITSLLKDYTGFKQYDNSGRWKWLQTD